MASQPPPPPKPWETRRIPGAGPGPGPGPTFQSADLGPTILTRPGQPTLSRVPPPILPRPSQQTGSSNVNTFRPAYSSFSSGYGAFGNSYYGSYSPYSYGYNGLGYNRLRIDDLPPSRFVQQAEESSRGAFQSIESIVHAFASVSMMMDATFSAVYNSFRAVLDVANHFSRLKIHFTKVFSAFALVRTIRYLYRRLQWMMGLRRGSENEDLWAESERTVACLGAEDRAANSAKSWPIFLFFAVILGGPYLIWKLLSTYSDEVTDSTNWASGEDDHVVARAEYDFVAVSEEEISFRAGDMLNLALKAFERTESFNSMNAATDTNFIFFKVGKYLNSNPECVVGFWLVLMVKQQDLYLLIMSKFLVKEEVEKRWNPVKFPSSSSLLPTQH
uniref:Peroxin-13 n=1 Tax=Sus scrofa TaxID=9823 RepID=A0A8D1WF64_PIG